MIVHRKKKTNWMDDFAIPAVHRMKIKEIEKRDKYLDLASELKESWNIKMMEISIVIGALGTGN